MAPKKRPVTTPRKARQAQLPKEQPMILSAEALADLRYFEPTRARDRLIACINELYLIALNLQHQHQPSEH